MAVCAHSTPLSCCWQVGRRRGKVTLVRVFVLQLRGCMVVVVLLLLLRFTGMKGVQVAKLLIAVPAAKRVHGGLIDECHRVGTAWNWSHPCWLAVGPLHCHCGEGQVQGRGYSMTRPDRKRFWQGSAARCVYLCRTRESHSCARSGRCRQRGTALFHKPSRSGTLATQAYSGHHPCQIESTPWQFARSH